MNTPVQPSEITAKKHPLPHIPKADIHAHIEGTIRPEIAKMIADRNGVTLSDKLFKEDGTYQWNGFFEFIRTYDDVARCLKNRGDYRDVTYHFLKETAAQNGLYAELIVSPNHADLIGLDRDEMMAGIVEGIEKAAGRFDIHARLNITCLRHEDAKAAEEVARYAAALKSPYVTGFNIAGAEKQGDLAAYKKAFEIAAGAGLGITAHLAEAASGQQVADALTHLPKLDRIGHGIDLINHPKILAEVKNKGITLEVCPSSNVQTGVTPKMEDHPFGYFYHMGLKVTLNTDDPPFFFTTIAEEYDIAQKTFGLSDNDLCIVTRNAIEAAFCDQALKDQLLKKLDAQLPPAPKPAPKKKPKFRL